MHGPAVVGWLLVGLCGGTGCCCLLRVRDSSDGPWRAGSTEAVMGLGMAVTALPMTGLPGLSHTAAAVALAAFSVGIFAGFLVATTRWPAMPGRAGAGRRSRHGAHHTVEALAMVYMALAMAGQAAGHAGHGPGGIPALTGPLVTYFALYALVTAPRLLPVAGGEAAGAGPGSADWRRSPEVVAACRVALAMAMLAMLLLL